MTPTSGSPILIPATPILFIGKGLGLVRFSLMEALNLRVIGNGLLVKHSAILIGHRGEPSPSHADSDRLQFFGYGSITDPEWNDVNHAQLMNGYIVEYVPEPATLLLLVLGGLRLLRKSQVN